MLDYSILQTKGIVVLKPHGPLSSEDFDGLTAAADSYLSDHAKIHGVLIQSKDFPGWESFGGFTAHMRFVHDHHKNVERIAVVTDSRMGDMAASLGKHFTSADVRHFPFADDTKALEWLETSPSWP
jgi:hypothetical protein